MSKKAALGKAVLDRLVARKTPEAEDSASSDTSSTDIAKSGLTPKQIDSSSTQNMEDLTTRRTFEIAGNEPGNQKLPTTNVRLSLIDDNPYQPRLDGSDSMKEESIQELADSISKNGGLLQPVVIRALDNGRFQMLGGARRKKAYELLGYKSIPAVIRVLTEVDAAILSFVDNHHREGNSDFETSQYVNRLQKEFQMSRQEVSAKLGINRRVLLMMEAFEKLPEKFIKKLRSHSSALNYTTAEAIVKEIARDAQLEDYLFTALEQSIAGEFPKSQIISRAQRAKELSKLKQLGDSQALDQAKALEKSDNPMHTRPKPVRIYSGDAERYLLSIDKSNSITIKPKVPISTEDAMALRQKVQDLIENELKALETKKAPE